MPPSNILFGATSILGYSIAQLYPDTVLPFVTRANRAKAIRRWPVLNLEDPAWPKAVFEKYHPELLLQCHAVCDVPRCEVAPEWAREINIVYLQRVIDALPEKTRLVYVSSDHVFGGDGIYDEDSPPCPISVYGRTRVEAEEMILQRAGSLVIRVGLPIGPSPNGRTGHWDWLRYRMARNLPVTIVYDEFRSVVWADDLAARVMRLAQSAATGVRHVTATRAVSRVELADHLLALFGENGSYKSESHYDRSAPHLGRVELASIYTDDMSRPLTSVLDSQARYCEEFAMMEQPSN
ncbi:MAG: NAD-dependent epimerase/dehydratase family protein [Deltaproteobacteria bacterium]|nr:NAD-dependent epimerase/dehydratase family protein [Deltaproteobacteria bacterium]